MNNDQIEKIINANIFVNTAIEALNEKDFSTLEESIKEASNILKPLVKELLGNY